jgi:DNA helicase-2/ATP-dependent DNA helicase PcrA
MDCWEAVYEEQPWVARRIAQLAEDLQAMSHMGPFAAMNYIRKGVGYEEFVRGFAAEHGQNVQELFDVMDELMQSAVGFQSLEQWQLHVQEYREKMQGRMRDKSVEGVQILTCHGAKGLEFDTVFLPQMLEGFLPYKKAVLPDAVEEERRLCYVGMTRAKNRLFLSYSKTLYNKEATASRFLAEMQDLAVAGVDSSFSGISKASH